LRFINLHLQVYYITRILVFLLLKTRNSDYLKVIILTFKKGELSLFNKKTPARAGVTNQHIVRTN